jgi:hypothetical protein
VRALARMVEDALEGGDPTAISRPAACGC